MVQTRNKLIDLPIHYKILRVLYELGHGDAVPLTLEKVTVAVFRKYPKEFSMVGYPQYPDTLKVSRRLYLSLKPEGLVRTADNQFQLTAMGIEVAKRLTKSSGRKSHNLPRALARELNRIISSQAYTLFSKGDQERILDSDFYEYIGASVRTPYNELLGRIASVERTVRQVKNTAPNRGEVASTLAALHSFLLKKFARELELRRSP